MLEEAVARRDKISFEEGMEKGRQKGRQEGREDSKSETACRLKEMGMDSALITAATDLSAEEIETLEGTRDSWQSEPASDCRIT